VHGTSAITAITAQSTLGVSAIHEVPVEIVLAQVRAVLGDIGADAVKVGMLGSAEVALAVAAALDELPDGTPVVVDPVMVAESGARLLASDAQQALVQHILPRASVLTPNVPEARALIAQAGEVGEEDTVGVREARGEGDEDAGGQDGAAGERQARGEGHAGIEPGDEDAQIEALARAVLALGPRAVVLTGGHRERAVDVYLDAEGTLESIDGVRHPDGAAHGSGCTHSSILAAQLALGHTPLQAARIARRMAGTAVAQGLRDIGGGPGPVDVIDRARMRAN